MAALLFIVGSALLFSAFFALTQWEAARGVRLFAHTRGQFDTEVERAAFIIDHVDWGAYLRDETRSLVARLGHFIAHLTLQVVRAMERLLTKAVRHLRTKVATEELTPRATERPFVRALGDFKEELRQSRPEIPEL